MKIENMDDAIELLEDIDARHVAECFDCAESCETIDQMLRNLHDLEAAAKAVAEQTREAIDRLRAGRY